MNTVITNQPASVPTAPQSQTTETIDYTKVAVDCLCNTIGGAVIGSVCGSIWAGSIVGHAVTGGVVATGATGFTKIVKTFFERTITSSDLAEAPEQV